MMQIDLVGKLNDSGGYKHILTGIDVFTRYLFAIPVKNVDAETIAKTLVGIFLRHSYIPNVILTDLGSVFVSKMFHELTSLLEIKLNHASVKHAQTVGTIERSHSALKKVLKIYENQSSTNWHKYVDYAVFAHNTSFHSSIGCTPSLLFHGREPLTPLELRFRGNMIERVNTVYDYNLQVKDAVSKIHMQAKDTALTSYQKYRSAYDKKAMASPLKLHSYCLLMDPRLTGQDMFVKKNISKWIPLFRVEQVLTNMNYIVRKIGTNYTQCVHRIRLRQIVPQYEVQDLPEIKADKFTADPILKRLKSEPELFDDCIPELIYNTPEVVQTPQEVLWTTPFCFVGRHVPIAPIPARLPIPIAPEIMPIPPVVRIATNQPVLPPENQLPEIPQPLPRNIDQFGPDRNQFVPQLTLSVADDTRMTHTAGQQPQLEPQVPLGPQNQPPVRTVSDLQRLLNSRSATEQAEQSTDSDPQGPSNITGPPGTPGYPRRNRKAPERYGNPWRL